MQKHTRKELTDEQYAFLREQRVNRVTGQKADPPQTPSRAPKNKRSVKGKVNRGRGVSPTTGGSKYRHLVSRTYRVPIHIVRALDQATQDRTARRDFPFVLQDIVEQALSEWCQSKGYLPSKDR